MRITEYDLEINENNLPCLVKENAFNYDIKEYNNPSIIVEMLNNTYRANKKAEENVYIFATDTKCHPIGIFKLSKGSVNASLCNAREILIRMLLCGCVNMFMIHNHPSKDTTPSTVDIKTFRRLKEASGIVGINLLDSIIIGGDTYLSFKEVGIQ